MPSDYNFSELKELIGSDKLLVEKKLAELLKASENAVMDSKGNTPLKTIYSATEYSLMAGGKRIRPFITLEACKLFDGDTEKALKLACAVEMIHTYSLIHDDLPCMDDDDLRRGKPTNHKVFGEAAAVLAGDALLTLAFNVAANSGLEPSVCVECIKQLSDAAGINGMVGGQIIDMENEQKAAGEISLKELNYMYGLKTGALLKVSASLGCLAANKGTASKEYCAVSEYAEKTGLAFQIVDDILDYTSTAEVLGKATSQDEKNGKITYLSFFSINKARAVVDDLTKDAIRAIEPYDKNSVFTSLAFYMRDRAY